MPQVLAEMKPFLAPAFRRAEQRASASASLDGLLSRAEHGGLDGLVEEAGPAGPDRLQSLPERSSWSADAFCDGVRRCAIVALGDAEGARGGCNRILKKVEHPVGVLAACASRFGHALIDRPLYLPEEWARNEARRAKACVAEDVRFATKPAMVHEMDAGILDAGVPCAFVLADAH